MAKYPINYLLKKEIIYEIRARTGNFTTDYDAKGADQLRKSLWKIIDSTPDFKLVEGKLKVKEEIGYCTNALRLLTLLLDKYPEEPSMFSWGKIKAKWGDLQLRMSIIRRSILQDDDQTSVKRLVEELQALGAKISD